LSEQSYAAALRQDTQQRQSQAPQTVGKSVQHPVQQHLPQQEFQRTGRSVQAPSSSNNKLKVATVVGQIMKELSEAVSEEDKVMIVTIMVFVLMQQNGC
jgi:molybdopterin converting factor small subunit